MKVKYTGDVPVQLSSIGVDVNPGDVISVPQGFSNALFEPVKAATVTKGAESVDAAKQ